MSYPDSQTRRGRVIDNGRVCPTLTTENIPNILEEWTWEIDGETYLIRIRKLTPRECWRLMGFTDEDFDKAKWKKQVFYLEGGNGVCNAKLKAVEENQRLLNTETYVSCTINDLQDMEAIRTEMKKSAEMQEQEREVSVCIATEKSEGLELSECATNIIRCGEYMGMRYSLIQKNDQQVMDIIVKVKKASMNTEKCMKITMESSLLQTRLFTILTLIAQIIESKIFSSTTALVNIQGYIAITENCEKNFQIRLSNLKMELTEEYVSNTNLYKQAGNSICVNVLEMVFRSLLGEDV